MERKWNGSTEPSRHKEEIDGVKIISEGAIDAGSFRVELAHAARNLKIGATVNDGKYQTKAEQAAEAVEQFRQTCEDREAAEGEKT